MGNSSQTCKLILKHLLTSLLPFSKACITWSMDSGSISYFNNQPKKPSNRGKKSKTPTLSASPPSLIYATESWSRAKRKFGYLHQEVWAILVGKASLSFVGVFLMPVPKEPLHSDVYPSAVYRVRLHQHGSI